jgi:hypothetical protein
MVAQPPVEQTGLTILSSLLMFIDKMMYEDGLA